jgi:hypothetical protein
MPIASICIAAAQKIVAIRRKKSRRSQESNMGYLLGGTIDSITILGSPERVGFRANLWFGTPVTI